jgi:beta-glucosidase
MREDRGVDVAFTVANTGARVGDEIAQVYVSPPEGAGRPPQKLEGFVRVTVAPGASRRLTVSLPPRAFAYWSDSWVVDAGRYEIHVGSSSRDHRLTAAIELPAAALGR